VEFGRNLGGRRREIRNKEGGRRKKGGRETKRIDILLGRGYFLWTCSNLGAH
jgi:hypothetical protein